MPEELQTQVAPAPIPEPPVGGAITPMGMLPGTPFYIYVHAKPDGTPFYVGKGSKGRCFDFINNRNRHFHHVVDKYGEKNILVNTYPCSSEQNAFDLEIIFIDLLRWDGAPLVNLTDGGDGVKGYTFTKEARRKMRAAQLGKTLPSEQRAKMSASHLGRRVSAETRAKISAALIGLTRSKVTCAKISLAKKGRPLSAAHRAAISAALKGRTFTTEHKRKISEAKRNRRLV